MQYVVDPYLVVDILDGDPEWGERSARLLDAHRKDTLIMAPLSYLALAPAFCGQHSLQDEFLLGLGISVHCKYPMETLYAAYDAWYHYQLEHPDATGIGSPFDALCLGAFALSYDGLLTRNASLYRQYFLSLRVLEP